MAIILTFKKHTYYLTHEPIIHIEKNRGSELIKINIKAGTKKPKICAINSFIEKTNLSKYISAGELFKLKLKTKHSIELAVISIIINSFQKTDYYIIENIGFDYKEIENISSIVKFFNNKGIKIYFIIHKPTDNVFKLVKRNNL